MSTARAFRLCLAVLPCFVATALASTITLPIVSGTMTTPSMAGLPTTIDVVTTAGSITGSTRVVGGAFFRPPIVTDVSLITFGGYGDVTHLHITVPTPIDIVTDGAIGDFVGGQLMSPLLTQVDQQTYTGYFMGQLMVQQFMGLDPDLYVFPGSGTVTVRTGLDSLGQAFVRQESFQFGATPEPSTAALCLLTLLGGAALLAVRSFGARLARKPVIKL